LFRLLRRIIRGSLFCFLYSFLPVGTSVVVSEVLSGDNRTGDGGSLSIRDRANVAEGSYAYRRTMNELFVGDIHPSQVVGEGAVEEGGTRDCPPDKVEGCPRPCRASGAYWVALIS
jgi:hypothetical protein